MDIIAVAPIMKNGKVNNLTNICLYCIENKKLLGISSPIEIKHGYWHGRNSMDSEGLGCNPTSIYHIRFIRVKTFRDKGRWFDIVCKRACTLLS